MAAVSLKSPKISYEPPKLPEYLKTVYDLKPIVGVPSDEEVKGIHTVIRAAYNASNGKAESRHNMPLLCF